jgi:hypothetical protein
MIRYAEPDLTRHPPRSVRVRLGGYAHLPRLLDKARAVVAGRGGAYVYNCSLDAQFFRFTGIEPDALLEEIRRGGSDGAVLAWVSAHSPRLPHEIAAWSQWLEHYGPGDEEMHAWFAEVVAATGPGRDDIRSYADLLDHDDYVSFGGAA